MPNFPLSVPGTALTNDQRGILLAALVYTGAGLVHLALAGIACSRPTGQNGFINRAVAVLGCAAAIVLWPLPPTFRAVGRLKARTRTPPQEDLVWRRPVPTAPALRPRPAPAPTPTSIRRAIPARPAYPPAPPSWYRQDHEAVRRALIQGRPGVAWARVCELVDDSTAVFGADHPYTLFAWALRAEAVNAAVTHLRAGTSTATSAAGSGGEPFGTVFLPLQCPDLDGSVYLPAPQPGFPPTHGT